MAETENRVAERRVRARIRRAFSQQRGRVQMKTLEDQVLKLIRDYCAAPAAEREMVYERGEKRLIRAVRSRTYR